MNFPLTDAERAQYVRRTTQRPLLSLFALAVSPLAVEALCRLLGAY